MIQLFKKHVSVILLIWIRHILVVHLKFKHPQNPSLKLKQVHFVSKSVSAKIVIVDRAILDVIARRHKSELILLHDCTDIACLN